VRSRLRAAGLDPLGSFPSSEAGGLDAALTAAMGLQPDLLIAGGGDGTLCAAARRLAHRDVALGVLPLSCYPLVTHQLNIANGSFHGGRPITRDASADDRLLLVYPLGGPSRWTLLGSAVRHALLGIRWTMDEPAFLAVRELLLDTDPPLQLDVDGEIRGHTPTRIVLSPQAPRVMVPAAFPDS
jgi:diacylglycerol kinase family enzyme